MAGPRIHLQAAEYRPAEHVRKKNVESDRGRLILAREFERMLPTVGHDDLEATVASEPHHDPRIVRIVLDDQEHRVRFFDDVTVVGHDGVRIWHDKNRPKRSVLRHANWNLARRSSVRQW